MVLKEVVAADPVGMTALVAEKILPLQTGSATHNWWMANNERRWPPRPAHGRTEIAVREFTGELHVGERPDANGARTWRNNFPAFMSRSRAGIGCGG